MCALLVDVLGELDGPNCPNLRGSPGAAVRGVWWRATLFGKSRVTMLSSCAARARPMRRSDAARALPERLPVCRSGATRAPPDRQTARPPARRADIPTAPVRRARRAGAAKAGNAAPRTPS